MSLVMAFILFGIPGYLALKMMIWEYSNWADVTYTRFGPLHLPSTRWLRFGGYALFLAVTSGYILSAAFPTVNNISWLGILLPIGATALLYVQQRRQTGYTQE